MTKKFATGDHTFEAGKCTPKCHEVMAKVATKTFSIPEDELKLIETIKDKALNKRVVISDSEAIRLGLFIAVASPDDVIVKFFSALEKMKKGRPKIK